MKAIFAALLLSSAIPGLFAGRASAAVSDFAVVKGRCLSNSHIAEGRVGEDLTKHQSRFFCDSAVLSVFSDDPKDVMIQFADAKSHHARQIGYAGRMLEGEPILAVVQVYLENGQATPVVEGYCKIFYSKKEVSGFACGAKIDEGDRRTVPVVSFEVVGPSTLPKSFK